MNTSSPTSRTTLPRHHAELFALARQGDQAAAVAIMRAYNRRLFRAARAILQDDGEAEEAVQEAYLRAFTAAEGFDGRAALATWLTRIVVNEALGRLRRRRIVLSLEDAAENAAQRAMKSNDFTSAPGLIGVITPEDEAARAEIRQLLERAVDTLPANFRSVFVLRAVEQLSVEETAACLGIPAATVKTRFLRARRQLRTVLDQSVSTLLPETFAFDGERCDRIVLAVGEALGLWRRDPPRGPARSPEEE